MKQVWPVIIGLLLLIAGPVPAGPAVFSTWEGLETDKLASIWLIQRFISPGATIVFHPKGTPPANGVAFDTPYSTISRKFNQSTFESMLSYFRLEDPVLEKIGRLIHDIEINVWEKKKYRKTVEMQVFFIDLFSDSQENGHAVKRANAYFDRLYDDLAGPMPLD